MERWEQQAIRKQSGLTRLLPWLALSSVLFFLILAPLIAVLFDAGKIAERTPVTLKRLSAEQWVENRTIKKTQSQKMAKLERKQERKKREKKKEPPKPEKPSGPIVDVAMPDKEEVPQDARYTSQYNIKVKKESKAKNRKNYKEAAPKHSDRGLKMPKQQVARKPDQVTVTPDNKPKGEQAKPQTPKKTLLPDWKQSSKLVLEDGGNRASHQNRDDRPMDIQGNNPDKLQMARREPTSPTMEDDGLGLPNNIPSSLLPNSEDAKQTAGGPMNDYLPDVEEGEGTWLNTRAFKYATYFNRIKRMVSGNWNPLTVQRRYDPYFTTYGYKDRHTRVWVSLDTHGNLEEVKIIQSCGVDYLDQEAVRAIAAAAPFPNPPEGIVEEGHVRFPFGFYLALNRNRFNLQWGK